MDEYGFTKEDAATLDDISLQIAERFRVCMVDSLTKDASGFAADLDRMVHVLAILGLEKESILLQSLRYRV